MVGQFCTKQGFAAFIVETGTGQHHLVLGLRAGEHASSGSSVHGIGMDKMPRASDWTAAQPKPQYLQLVPGWRLSQS